MSGNDLLLLIFQIIVLFFSMSVHEVFHGLVAYRLGDDTAKVMGRLSLNPFRHIEIFGSIILPLFLVLTNSPILFMWAKPVPYNPLNLKNPKTGAALIGLAGPLSNFFLAIIFGIIIRLIGAFMPGAIVLILFFNIIVYLNILFAVFNLVPIYPLDGSKLLFAFLPDKYHEAQRFMEQYGIFILLVFILFLFDFINPLINGIFHLIVGKWASI